MGPEIIVFPMMFLTFGNRSFAHNEESNVCFFDRRLADQLHETFLDDVGESDRVTAEQWAKRGLRARGQEFLASFMQEQA